MRAILVGAVESSRIALQCLARSPAWDLGAIFTLPPELAQRHSDFVDLSADARAAGAPLITLSNINSDAAFAEIKAIDPDYIFVIGWSQICGARFMASARLGLIGFHPAPLPRLRGRAVIPWTILLDEPISASSLFLIDEGVDSGPILGQRYFHVAPDETAATLYAKHMAMLDDMLPGVLDDVAQCKARMQSQDERYATYATRRRPEDAVIDWSEPADKAGRLIRACGAPYPGAWTMLDGERIVIEEARPVCLPQYRAAMTGQIVERQTDGFLVKCGDGRGLLVTRWRRAREGPLPVHAILGLRAGAKQ
ncbi:MAG: formyltransferase family protein [Pseudomonadota bacterium]|jgi:methionyl-tRNA formyltransferase